MTEAAVQRPYTSTELAEAEQHAGDMINVYVDTFKNFPTAQNFVLLAERLREFQFAWMNGRERPRQQT